MEEMEPGAQTVDSHQHFWQIGRFQYHWMRPDMKALYRDFLPANLRPLLDTAGIQQTVAVQAHGSVDETRWLLSLADQHPWIAGVVGWVDLAAPDVGETLAELAQYPKLKAIRAFVHDIEDPQWLLRPEVLRGLAEVERHGLAYDLLFRPQHLKLTQPVVDRLPGLRLVIDHIAKPLIREGVREPWAKDIAEAAKVPGLYCKVSGMVTEADHVTWTPRDLQPYISHVLEHFGEDRVVFGSDWPVCLLAASYLQVVEALDICLEVAGVGKAGRDKIFGLNASRLYRLQ